MTSMLLIPQDFIQKWTASTRSERAASQEHFIDLCHLLGQPTPNSDPTGESYAFEKGATKTTGHDGFADVWKRGHFAWEYKGKHKNLAAAYKQLLQYREDLENPPLLVVCDLERFEVHTNFTGTVKRVFKFTLADLLTNAPTPECPLLPLDVLRALFTEPDRLRPEQTAAQVTEQAAAEFAALAESLRQRGADPQEAAHFLMRLLFCLFAEDIGLLPKGLFARLVANTRASPPAFTAQVRQLFVSMASGGWFGPDPIAHFNGGLFADGQALELTSADMAVLERASRLDWSSIEPAIFGTLFERSLDPSKRSQLGAHYTSREDILLVVEPVLMAPLRRRWEEVQQEAAALTATRDEAIRAANTRYETGLAALQAKLAGDSAAVAVGPQAQRLVERRTRDIRDARSLHQQALQKLLTGFAGSLAAVLVLDPACGSGNFLYVALKRLLDLEKEVINFASKSGMMGFFHRVGPEQLHGIEINAYAHELAQVVVWIGYIQWLLDNSGGVPSEPILKPLDTIRRTDAILAHGEGGQPVEPAWPEADYIIGNPPFLGGKLLRRGLGDEYVDELFALYAGRVPREADLVTYWFERARALIADGKAKRAGLLATQSIRGGANRRVLERIKATGDIFMAWSDRPWILEGAAVHVSIVGYDGWAEPTRTLDGSPVAAINPNLTGSINLTAARRIGENLGLAFMADTKGGAFDIPGDLARTMLRAPLNPNGRPNADVVVPWVNSLDITRRPRDMWIIDFGAAMSETDAALYEAPFEYLAKHVKQSRTMSRTTRQEWWLHERPRPEMRRALSALPRYIVTPTVSKHRLFVWVRHPTLPDHQLIAIARADDYFFGVLHSRPHELWAFGMGTQLREFESGFRYTPTSTFETFPFPWPPGQEPADDPRVHAIAQAAREVVEKRDAWLNPPGASAADLKQRTLTNLYNQRPAWLDMAHQRLDQAVLDAYGWPHTISDDGILDALLSLNLEREPT